MVIVPVAVMLIVSGARGVFVARGTVLLAPYFVIAAALVVDWIWRRKPIPGLAALLILLALHVGSIVYFKGALACPRDYRELASKLTAELAAEDKILVADNFIYPPLFYYLDAESQLVHEEHEAALEGSSGRAWVVRFDDNPLSPEISAAVAGWKSVHKIEARGGYAEAFDTVSHTQSLTTD